MKILQIIFGLLLLLNIVLSSTSANSYTLEEAFGILSTAIGTQAPDPVGLLVVVEGMLAFKTGLISRCKSQILKYNNELDNNPNRERVVELYDLIDRYQAVIAAFNMDKEPLEKWNENQKKRARINAQKIKDREKKMREQDKKEELDNMADVISRLRARAQNVYNSAKQDMEADIKLKKEIEILDKQKSEYINQLKFKYFKILDFAERREKDNPCFTAKGIEKKIKALSILSLKNEKKYYMHINLAKKRLKDCEDNSDTQFIKFNFNEAKKIAAQMEKDLAEAHGLTAQSNKLFKEYNTLKEEFNEKVLKLLDKEGKNISNMLLRLLNLHIKRRDISRNLAPPYIKIRDIETYAIKKKGEYLPIYPKSKGEWNDLLNFIHDVKNDIKGDYDDTIYDIRIMRLAKELKELEEKFSDPEKLKLSHCYQDSYTEQIKDKAEAAKNLVLLDLAGNSNIPDLANDCSNKKRQPPQGFTPPQGTTPPSKGATPQRPQSQIQVPTKLPTPSKPATIQTNSTHGTTPMPSPQTHYGGLFISGKKELISGEASTFTAQDGAGTAYTSGVTWSVSVEDVFIIGDNGTGVAFKAGACTIIAHKDDMAAYYDITVLARVPDLIGKDLKQAVNELNSLGLTGLPVKVSTKKNMRVTGQSISPGSPARADTTIVLEVEEAKGPSQVAKNEKSDEENSKKNDKKDEKLDNLTDIKDTASSEPDKRNDTSQETLNLLGEKINSDNSNSQRPDLSTNERGFSDEGTSYGSDEQETEFRTDNASTDSETADGFVDEGTQIGPKPQKEQVSYFDKDWRPRSWEDKGDSQLTRFHIYQTATRLAMAAAFAKYLDARADGGIAAYIRQAIEHMKKANQYSFEPHKAWPDWKEKSYQLNSLADRITKRSLSQRNYLRKGLTSKLAGTANSMAKQLETLSRGRAGSIENCDSLYFRIGYHLAFSAQLRIIANDAEKAGLPEKWIRRVNSRAKSNATIASRYIYRTKASAAKAGCIDMKSLITPLRKARNFSNDHSGSGLYYVWSKGNEMLQHVGGPIDIEKIGRYVFANMRSEMPRGTKLKKGYNGPAQDKRKGWIGYFFTYSKEFRFGSIGDTNPGLYASLYYKGKKHAEANILRHCKSKSDGFGGNLVNIENRFYNAHGGNGRICNAYTAAKVPIDSKNLFNIIWHYGDWSIELYTVDYPNHPASMYGGQQGQRNYMIRILNKLIPRVKQIATGYIPDVSGTSNNQPASESSDGGLLGIKK